MDMMPTPSVGPRSAALRQTRAHRDRPVLSAPSVLAAHHLVHCPDTPEAFLLDSAAPVRQSFAFSAELPVDHPLFSDTVGAYHDLLFPVESLREAALFAAQRYFRVSPKRHVVFVSGAARITAIAPWRITTGRSQVGLGLDLTPTDIINGVPRGLDCRATVSIDGQQCGTAEARLAFLMPGAYRNHRTIGRLESERTAAPSPDAYGIPGAPVPERIGRRSARNVLVGLPADTDTDVDTGFDADIGLGVDPGSHSAGPGLTFPVDILAAQDVLPGETGEVPAALILEASRQAALLAAAELYGFRPGLALLTRWKAAFCGFAEPGIAMQCTVTPAAAEPGCDRAGRAVAELQLSFTQGSRVVANASASVLQDC
ncbi:AfsA-related hotdog domain-containing protein [Streptomyces sp. A5-4]|uniref:AfsA-related hotdog domain-containing protein n=1 Tax=Streptomyces sp. A5-4 TaxID=3384771 RepID=UPI003DA80602